MRNPSSRERCRPGVSVPACSVRNLRSRVKSWETFTTEIAGKSRRAGRQQDIPRGVGEFHVCGDRSYDCGLNPAAVEGVCLDKVRSPCPRWSGGLGKVSHLTSLNLAHLCQRFFSRGFSWARCNAESTFAGRREYTSFRRSVIAFPCCRFRNSAIAFAYSSLLETPKATGSCFGQAEKIVGHGDGGLHGSQYDPSYTQAVLRNPLGWIVGPIEAKCVVRRDSVFFRLI